MEDNIKVFKAQCKGPINIALIKYWGKDNEKLITPLNNSISLTLDTDNLYTTTKLEVIVKEKENKNDSLYYKVNLKLNGTESNNTSKIEKIIDKLIQNKKEFFDLENKFYVFNFDSVNNFPTASGCASSASSMSSIAFSLNEALNLKLSLEEISRLARLGSGSACRSIFGGIVEWEKEGGDLSSAKQLFPKNYWELKVMLIIVDSNKKKISSRDGMKISKETSSFLKYRIETIVPENIKNIKEALKNKNFEDLGKVIMKESNNFHAVCRDSYPSFNFLNEQSEYLMKAVYELNQIENKIICAYTFDAGSNCFIIYEKCNEDKIVNYFKRITHEDKGNNETENELIKNRPDKTKFIKEVIFSIGDGVINI